MTPTESISTCYEKYFDFKGRASRSEYWWFSLFGTLMSMFVSLCMNSYYGTASVQIDPSTGEQTTTMAYWFALITNSFCFNIPAFSASVRRYHDTGRSGWWWLLCFTGIGIFFCIYWLAKRGDVGVNKYGQTQ